MPFTFEEYYVKRTRMGEFLQGLGETEAPKASFYLPPGLTAEEINSLTVSELPEKVMDTVVSSPYGAVIFTGGAGCLVVPPFPVKEKVIFTEFAPDSLQELVSSDLEIGLILVHLGSYAVGVTRGERLLSSKVGSGHIQGRTKKGGSSSARYQRRRQNQAREFLERVCERARNQITPNRKTMSYLQYGGPGHTVRRLKQFCPYLASLDIPELPLIDVPPLKQEILDRTIVRLWSSRIIRWREEV